MRLAFILLIFATFASVSNAQNSFEEKKSYVTKSELLIQPPEIKTRADQSVVISYRVWQGEDYITPAKVVVIDTLGNEKLSVDAVNTYWDFDSLFICLRNKKTLKSKFKYVIDKPIVEDEYYVYSGIDFSLLYSFKTLETQFKEEYKSIYLQPDNLYGRSKELRYFGDSEIIFTSKGLLKINLIKPKDTSFSFTPINGLKLVNNPDNAIYSNSKSSLQNRDSILNRLIDIEEKDFHNVVIDHNKNGLAYINFSPYQGFIDTSENMIIPIDCSQSTCSGMEDVFFRTGIAPVSITNKSGGSKNRILSKKSNNDYSNYELDCVGENYWGNLNGAYRSREMNYTDVGNDTFFIFHNNKLYLIPILPPFIDLRTGDTFVDHNIRAYHLPLSIPKMFIRKDEEDCLMDTKGKIERFSTNPNEIFQINDCSNGLNILNYIQKRKWYYCVSKQIIDKVFYSVIDDSAKFLVPWQKDIIESFNEGVMVCRNSKNQLYAKDVRNNKILSLKFDEFKTFSEGYLIIKSYENAESYNATYTFYDRKGEPQFTNFTFTDANPFYNGLAKVMLKGDSLYNYLTKDGKLIFNRGYYLLDDFTGWPVRVGTGTRPEKFNNYVYNTGKLVLKNPLDNKLTINKYSEGLAFVRDKPSSAIKNLLTSEFKPVPDSLYLDLLDNNYFIAYKNKTSGNSYDKKEFLGILDSKMRLVYKDKEDMTFTALGKNHILAVINSSNEMQADSSSIDETTPSGNALDELKNSLTAKYLMDNIKKQIPLSLKKEYLDYSTYIAKGYKVVLLELKP